MTNKIVLKTADELISGYTPTYIPLLPTFLPKGKQYSMEEATLNFKTIEAKGDLRAKIIGAKDTVMHMISAGSAAKKFVKYFYASKFVQSNFQSSEGYEDVVAQVLDENNKQADEIFLSGDGQNNGLLVSTDVNYETKASAEVAKDTDGSHLADLYQKVISAVEEASNLAGQKLVLIYGDLMIAKYNSLFAKTNNSFSSVLGEALDANVEKIPKAITPAGQNGFLVINMDQIQLHYTVLPQVHKNGVNEEHNYAWTNFIIGSMMLDVKTKGGVVKQPLTFEA